VACRSTTECVAVDDTGQQVTFNPKSPGTPAPSTIDSGNGLSGIACPSGTQCTAGDFGGNEVTFNPTSPGSPTPHVIDGNSLESVACASSNQCTAVDSSGNQVTFNPASPGSPTLVQIDPVNIPLAVACPSSSQCNAVETGGSEVAFDPTSSATPTVHQIDGSFGLNGVACPSTTQCTAVDANGQQLTFNPNSPGTPTMTTVDGTDNLSAVACPSAIQCTAVDGFGKVVTFNPSSTAGATPTRIAGANTLEAIACQSTGLCVAVDVTGNAFVSTASTATALVSSVDPSAVGQQMTYTATVAPIPDGGTVAFTDAGAAISGCGSAAVDTSTGKASCRTAHTTAGSHSIVATYSGDPSFSGSAAPALTETVNKASTSTTTSSANPSSAGRQVTFTATVVPAPDGGTVSFKDGASALSGCGAVAVSSSTGKAACNATFESAGTHTIVAAYSGNANFNGSQAAALTQVVRTSSTTTALRSSANPSVAGQQVTYTATIAPNPGGGTVRFTDGRSTLSGCGSARVNASTGTASCRSTYKAPGRHTIQATYSRDSGFARSTSRKLTEGVKSSLRLKGRPSAKAGAGHRQTGLRQAFRRLPHQCPAERRRGAAQQKRRKRQRHDSGRQDPNADDRTQQHRQEAARPLRQTPGHGQDHAEHEWNTQRGRDRADRVPVAALR